MDVLLSNLKWELKGYFPWVPLKETSMETGQKLSGVTDFIEATVPGGVHFDLYRNGLISHPYKDLNSLNCEWVENRWWIYKTEFPIPKEIGEKVELVFKGLDYEAILYVNDTFLAEHEGMYHPLIIDITEIAKKSKDCKLVVLFKSPPEEMGQIGKTSLTKTQKSRFNYKWDFSTRLVNIGIWQDVLLRIKNEYSLEELYIRSSYKDNIGKIDFEVEISNNTKNTDEKKLQVLKVECLDSTEKVIFSKNVQINKDNIAIDKIILKNPQLWYPNGYGKQHLYKIKLFLYNNEKLCDTKEVFTGIRELSYQKNENSPTDSLPYTFVINGKKIYIKGVNITPLDHLYGNVKFEQYEHMVLLMKNANVNMVRVWGGGIIEKEEFYNLCDKYGIMVWQEFIQSSSGIDNIPSKDKKFLELLNKTAIAAIKQKRNHVSLSVWSGGNELMSAPDTPSTYDDKNICMLHELVKKYDKQRLFLPTSASGPVEFITDKKNISHDVHGHWRYGGNPEHYKIYSQSDSLFHSEFGMDGLSSLKSLKKFLSKEHLVPTPMSENIVWRHHGDWWGTYYRDTEMFGEIENISLFCDCSQWIQAEGLRFIVEANRRRKFQNSGSIIWQLNEPWPNSSCTNLVDYYGECKMAYYWIKKSFSNLHVSLEYNKLDYPIGEKFSGKIFLHNSQNNGEFKIIVKVKDKKGCDLYTENFDVLIRENSSKFISNLDFNIDERFGKLFFVCFEIEENEKQISDNTYIFSTQSKEIYKSSIDFSNAKLEIVEQELDENEKIQDGLMVKKYKIKNIGEFVALHVYPQEISNDYWIYGKGFYETIFPGQVKDVKIYYRSKIAGGFLIDDVTLGIKKKAIEIEFNWFGKG